MFSATQHLHPQPYMRERYSRLILVSHRRHIDALSADDKQSLIVCSDWLVWRQCRDLGLHCLHLEAGLLDDAKTSAADTDFFIQANQWVYDQGKDVTLFEGASIGKLFTREISLVLLSCHQIKEALRWFCATFQPGEIVLFDVRTEYGLVDDTLKRRLVNDAAIDCGASVDDRLDGPENTALDFPFTDDFRVRPAPAAALFSKTSARDALRFAYSFLVSKIFAAKWRWDGKRKLVLILPTGLMCQNLIDNYDRQKVAVAPLLFAHRESKTWAFLKACWQGGSFFAHLPAARLTSADRRRVRHIRDDAKRLCDRADNGLQGCLRHYVRHYVVDHPDFERLCLAAKRSARFFDQKKPARIIVSDVMNPGTREYIEQAYARNCPVDYLPHGMRISRQIHDTLSGDPHTPAFVSRMLGWGEQGRDHLVDTDAKCEFVRIGYPGLDKLRDMAPPNTIRRNRNALILPYSADSEGFVNMASIIYPLLVETVRVVRKHGFENIRIKIHPGSKFNKAYYEEALAGLDEPVELVHEDQGLSAYLEWADIVVGPIVSGAFVETLAAGKPFYTYLTQPSVNAREYLRGVDLLEGPDDLDAALARGDDLDPESILQYFCSGSDIPNASRRVWEIMAA